MSGGLIKVFGKKGLKIPAPELGAHEYANAVVLDPAAKLQEAKKLPPWQILGLDGVKVTSADFAPSKDEFLCGKYAILRKGKRDLAAIELI